MGTHNDLSADPVEKAGKFELRLRVEVGFRFFDEAYGKWSQGDTVSPEAPVIEHALNLKRREASGSCTVETHREGTGACIEVDRDRASEFLQPERKGSEAWSAYGVDCVLEHLECEPDSLQRSACVDDPIAESAELGFEVLSNVRGDLKVVEHASYG